MLLFHLALLWLWITEDVIPLEKQYANFFTVDLCNWFATTRCLAQLDSLYRTISVLFWSGTGNHGDISCNLDASPKRSSQAQVIWKLSLHSMSEKSFITTLFHLNVLWTCIQQDKVVWVSSDSAKCRIKDKWLLCFKSILRLSPLKI